MPIRGATGQAKLRASECRELFDQAVEWWLRPSFRRALFVHGVDEQDAVSIRGVGCRSQKVSHRREARGSAQRGRLFFEQARLAGTGLTQQNIRSLLTQRVDGQPGWLRRVGLQHDVAGNIGES